MTKVRFDFHAEMTDVVVAHTCGPETVFITASRPWGRGEGLTASIHLPMEKARMLHIALGQAIAVNDAWAKSLEVGQ
jgi:hypothetical protein